MNNLTPITAVNEGYKITIRRGGEALMSMDRISATQHLAKVINAHGPLLKALEQAVSTLDAVDPVYELVGQEAEDAQAAWDKDMARYRAAIDGAKLL